MVVDGSKEEQIEEQLEPVIEATEEYYHGASHFWLHAGETSPTIGLVGAVFGLILALQKLVVSIPPLVAKLRISVRIVSSR